MIEVHSIHPWFKSKRILHFVVDFLFCKSKIIRICLPFSPADPRKIKNINIKVFLTKQMILSCSLQVQSNEVQRLHRLARVWDATLLLVRSAGSKIYWYVLNSVLGAPEVTANLYCNCVHLYLKGCVICSIYLRLIMKRSVAVSMNYYYLFLFVRKFYLKGLLCISWNVQ